VVFDFRLPRVKSISASGHKFGLSTLGVGWVLWRDRQELPDELIFHVNYLGGDMGTFTLNLSRPGSQVVAQYYSFLRLGFEGYRRVQQTCREVAMDLAAKIEAIGPYELLSRGDELPVFAFRLKDEVTNFTVFDVSRRMRERGWQVPAYTMPPNREDLAVLRVVVRNGMSSDLAALFLADLVRFTGELAAQPGSHVAPVASFKLRIWPPRSALYTLPLTTIGVANMPPIESDIHFGASVATLALVISIWLGLFPVR